MPLVGMASYAIIYRHGLEAFVESAQRAGMAGVIVPDLLIEEARPMAEICRKADFGLIQLVAPTTSRDRALQITETSTGFLYYVSVTGITGERTQLPMELVENVGWLREQTELPICIGFGISQPQHVQMLAPVADGLIVGSAIVRRMAEVTDASRCDVERNWRICGRLNRDAARRGIGRIAIEQSCPDPHLFSFAIRHVILQGRRLNYGWNR